MAESTHVETFNCNSEKLYSLITDYEHYSEFIPEVKSTRVWTEGEHKMVEYEVSIIKSFKYTLKMTEKPFTEVKWDLAEGKIFKKMSGSWQLQDIGDNLCKATYTVDLGFGIFVPKPVIKTLQTVNLRSLMQAFHDKIG